MKNSNFVEMYKKHHEVNHRSGFSLLEKERGSLLTALAGQNKNILDVGCRDGVLTKYFVKNNIVLGIDIDDNALKLAKKNLGIDTIQMDLNGDWSALGGRKFDVIFAGEILEHLYYPDKILQKIKNHLTQGGVFIGSVPNAFSFKNRLRYLLGRKKNTPLEDPTHINQFSYKDIKNLMDSHFNNVKIIGLGRARLLAKICPNLFAFDLFFVCK